MNWSRNLVMMSVFFGVHSKTDIFTKSNLEALEKLTEECVPQVTRVDSCLITITQKLMVTTFTPSRLLKTAELSPKIIEKRDSIK